MYHVWAGSHLGKTFTCAQQGCVICKPQIGLSSAFDCNSVMVFLQHAQHDVFRINVVQPW